MSDNPFDSVKYSNDPESYNSQSSFEPENKQGVTSWIFGFVVLSLLITGFYLASRQFITTQQPQPDQLPKPVPVEKTTLTVTVSANGTVDPENLVNVSPKNAGILQKLFVEEGDYVSQGQAIAKMDDTDLQGQLIEAKGKLAQAEANLTKLINGNRPQEIAIARSKLTELEANLSKLIAGNRDQEIAGAAARLANMKAILLNAEDDYLRNERLFREGAIAQQTLNQKRAIKDSAEASVKEAAEELSLLKEGTRQEEIAMARAAVKTQQETLDLLISGSRKEEIEQANGAVLSALGYLQTIETKIEDTIIKAPFSGLIAKKYADPGAFVTPMTSGSSVSSATSSSILALASSNEILANVAENNIAKIARGQKVLIEADAFPLVTFEGKVSQIASQAQVEQNVTSFEVKIALDQKAQQQLSAGMNVSVEFQVGQVENVLTVPTIAVTRKDNVTGVYVGAPNQPPRFVPITTGVTLNNRTEVKSGLDGTEHILTNVTSDLPPKPGFSWQNLFRGSSNDGPPEGGPPPQGGPPEGGPPPGGPM
jgi:HlyD family secretion protein